MNHHYRVLGIILILGILLPFSLSAQKKDKPDRPEQANWRVDNNRYWKIMADKGLSTLNPMTTVPKATYTGSTIEALSSFTLDSPDVPVTTENSTQSENSIFVNPQDPQNVLNSNNSTANPYPPLYGANDLYSFDGGLTWTGEIQGAGIDNSGDPAVVIGNNGWYYVNHITAGSWTLGQQVAYSTDQGGSWTVVTIDDGASSWVLDKNHFWIDNCLTSPYEGHLYCAWTDFGGLHDNDIALSYSSDEGLSWSSAINVSGAVNAGSHCQGVNINTGPNGEVYAAFSIYDASGDENAIGLAKSLDGGATWQPASRIIENIRGIRSSQTSKNQRVNSFPVLAVDISGGSFNGNLYLVWTNIGTPGINTGSDIDVYMIRSEDQGDTWSEPIRVNQDEAGLGSEHYFPWIACDPSNGALSVVFYDDRNVGGNQCEVFCANSFDAGDTWEDFKVSDVAFTPSPVPGLADGYMGDYLGITALDGYVYPCWTDNRTGTTMTYVSPYVTNNLSRPYDLIATLNEETGTVDLEWQYDQAPGFLYFIVYRDGAEIAQTTEQDYTDQLPDYGVYNYKVTAFYEIEGESTPASANLQWGNPHIFVDQDELEQTLLQDETAIQYLDFVNTGELELNFAVSTHILTDKGGSKSYCSASGGCDEYIGNVAFGDINNTSDCGQYQDFTDLSTDISAGETLPITITNGNTWVGDVCGIWIDWDQDGDFANDDPIMVNGGPDVYTANITPPDYAAGGNTTMRIRIQYYGTPEPCGTTDYGEVEDYSLNVITWLMIEPKLGAVLPGDTLQADVTFDATGLDLGDYFAEFTVTSNDPDMPQMIIPVTLHVTEYAVIASADPTNVCLGGQVQLDVSVIGGLGSYAYTWTSDPPGFTSTLRNPVVTPSENTVYTVLAQDGVNTGSGDVSVQVHAYPEVALGNDTIICSGEEITFDAGAGQSAYLWQDGSAGQTFTAYETGIYWVDVSNEWGCTRRDSVTLEVMTVPVQAAKPAGPSFIDLYEVSSGTYASSDLPGDNEYTWEILPQEAGEIIESGPEATINWDMDFTGPVWIKVMAENMCGPGMWSDSLEVTVVNTTGIAETMHGIIVDIYPNPNQGTFNFSISSPKEVHVNIFIFDQTGALVYNAENRSVKGVLNETINLEMQAAGIYNMVVEKDNFRIDRKIIVNE